MKALTFVIFFDKDVSYRDLQVEILQMSHFNLATSTKIKKKIKMYQYLETSTSAY